MFEQADRLVARYEAEAARLLPEGVELFDAPDKILHTCNPFIQASPEERSAPGRQ